ncbi:probable protein phosphatase 2C 55 [Quercus suber]|uniref:Protein phosphatase n=1 Tax=Quercus suber TaxID=58331 RepID=A0AAW0KX11_QUESU|nr:probable protein phosphatase 2C 55 [Quercus suber]POE61504.1 putative protein phosphatase 2c 55 [Quercus suber]
MIFKKQRVDGKVVLIPVVLVPVVLIPVLQEQERGCMRMSFGSHYTRKDKAGNPQSEGDDAHFICAEKNTIGVADGVGGWARYGVDAGKYARQLMSNVVTAVQRQQPPLNLIVDLRQALEEGFLNTKAMGSSTACIVTFKDYYLRAINVGNSGFMIFRNSKCVYKSLIQQHGFNYPYQLGNSMTCDKPCSAIVTVERLSPGDIIVLGTGGLLDNMFTAEIEDIISKGTLEGVNTEKLASTIAHLALFNSMDKNVDSPFAQAARLAGLKHNGGKRDDITVIVGHVIV